MTGVRFESGLYFQTREAGASVEPGAKAPGGLRILIAEPAKRATVPRVEFGC